MFNLNGFSPAQDLSTLGMIVGNSGADSGYGSNMHDFGLPQASTESAGAMTIVIRKLYLGETRPQNNQWRRNYNAFLDGNTHTAIQEALVHDNASMTNPVKLAAFLSQNAPIVQYSATAEKQVNIANGWDTCRYRFTMVVDMYRNGHYQKTEFVSGYTDYMGVNNAQMENSFSMDPQMVFRINQVTDASSRYRDAAGNPIPLVSASSQVLANSEYSGIASPTQMISMRPRDVVDIVGKLEFYDGFAAADELGVGAPSYRDLSSVIGGMPQMSSADNALIPTFTARMINSLHSASLSDFDPLRSDDTSVAEIAKQRVSESVFSASALIHVMNRHLGNGVTVTAMFTMADLLRLDPTIDDRTVIFGRTFESGSVYVPDGSGVESIGKVSRCALAATCLSNTILQLMSKGGVSMMALHVDNLTGVDEGVVQAANGMDYDGGLAQRLEMVKTRLILEAIPMIKPDVLSSYEVDILADAFNDVFVQVTIDGESDQFLIPSFASSSFSPVVTSDMGNVIGVARSINSIVNDCNRFSGSGTNLVDSTGNAFSGLSSGHEAGFGSNY